MGYYTGLLPLWVLKVITKGCYKDTIRGLDVLMIWGVGM